jgi:hypothetical protein
MLKLEEILMSKDSKTAATAAGETAIPLSLHDFCIRLSETEKRVELIAGFEADERSNGRKKDTAANFAVRFQAFLSKPA